MRAAWRPFWHTWHCSGGALTKYLLRLFVTGASSRTGTAIANLRRICEQELRGRYELEIIDVLEFPELAEDEKILATPTLIKSLPLPLRRVIGDLSNTEKVLLGLEVHPQRDPAPAEGKEQAQ
jgi:circadian clock protein KaiB